MSSINVKGAKEHNLKNINVKIPRDALTVVTGLSGSGKSSLAFDTIYAEGQRRYVESLSAYARQFLELMQKPDVDSIEGLSPAISIEQKTTSRNPRSTVGTVTEIYDYMRLLYSRVGTPYSPETGLPIEAQTISQMVDRVLDLPEGTRIYLISPVVRGKKGEFKKEIEDLGKRGFQRLKVDGDLYEIDQIPKLEKTFKHDIEVVVDRVVVRDGLSQRLADSFETAIELSDGLAITEDADNGNREVFSSRFACPVSGFTIEEIEPRLFSFNNPFGACPSCDGLGSEIFFDAELIVPDKNLSISEGAIAPWSDTQTEYYQQALKSLSKHFGFSLHMPWKELSNKNCDILLFGSGKTPVEMFYEDGSRTMEIKRPFEGIIRNMERRWQETDSARTREDLSKYQIMKSCNKCDGYRLKPQALAVKLDNKHIGEVANLSIGEAKDWFQSLDRKLTPKENEISRRILREINERLRFLINVGLDYLSLSRSSRTLSGGESQRIRLASQIGSGLTGVLYVLDEPSIGLHQRDNDRLLSTLKKLRDLGNTIIVVEHDEEAMLSADYLVDMGPGAGVHGGQVVAKGSPPSIINEPRSLTGQYLNGLKFVVDKRTTRKLDPKKKITITGARQNNLQNITANFPLGLLTCITGVSGSGKSTLVLDTLYKTLAKRLSNARVSPGVHDKIAGLEFIDKVVDINQSPIGRTPRSNPATYTGAFTPIREWFAGLPEAKTRGYKAGRFSFNVKGGRCEACTGDGLIKIEMHFLPDVYVQCDECKGKRYNRETLEITFRGKSIADVLDLTVEEGLDFFKAVPIIREKMETLVRVGLGYIHLGQQATTLSGGEAQRVKLAKELSRKATGKTVYFLDEPTTGLHFEDVKKLLEVLNALVDQGNTVIVIEHNLDVINASDHIIDLGPEGGFKGGKVLATGSPQEISKSKLSYTGQYLQKHIKSLRKRETSIRK